MDKQKKSLCIPEVQVHRMKFKLTGKHYNFAMQLKCFQLSIDIIKKSIVHILKLWLMHISRSFYNVQFLGYHISRYHQYLIKPTPLYILMRLAI